MDHTSRHWRDDFVEGTLQILPLLLAVAPIGLLFGTLAVGKGLTAVEALLMSTIVFAGAAQFVAVDMWTLPVPVLLLTFTAFIVNVRHVLMSASLSRHLPSVPRRLHPVMAYLLVDESWAIAEKRALTQPVTFAFFMGVGMPMWLGWQLATLAGALLGRTLGDPAALGIDFAFSALFISILMGFWKGARTGAVLVIASAAAVLAKLYLPGAWYIVVGGVAGAACAALLHAEEEA